MKKPVPEIADLMVNNPCGDPSGWPPRFVVPATPAPIQQGWLCPRCGRGNAPLTATCPCMPLPALEVTC